MRRWGIPYSRHGTHPSLLTVLAADVPITFIDVGASDAMSVKRQCGFVHALLVEPQPSRVEQLRRLLPSTNVVVAQTALANERGELPMDILRWDYSSSLLPVDRSQSAVTEKIDLSVRETITVSVTTLDDLCDATGIQNADLLKLDVQGAELMVLRGADQILGHTRFVLTEVSFRPYYIGGASFEQILAHMRARGFRLLSLSEGFRDATGELVEGDALFGQ